MYALWVNRSGPWLTHRAYENLGGVRGALRKRADATYEALNTRQKNLAKEIFLRLTNVNEGLPPTRRRAAREHLELTDVPTAGIDQLLEVFSRANRPRLLVGDGDSYVVAHDALYAEWPTLRDWLAKDKEGAHTRSELAQSATQWQRNKWRARLSLERHPAPAGKSDRERNQPAPGAKRARLPQSVAGPVAARIPAARGSPLAARRPPAHRRDVLVAAAAAGSHSAL